MKAYKPYYHQARRQEHIARVSDDELIENLEEVVVPDATKTGRAQMRPHSHIEQAKECVCNEEEEIATGGAQRGEKHKMTEGPCRQQRVASRLHIPAVIDSA